MSKIMTLHGQVSKIPTGYKSKETVQSEALKMFVDIFRMLTYGGDFKI